MTSSPAVSASGRQDPTTKITPEASPTRHSGGDLASDFGAHYGLPPDDWQRLLLDHWLATDHGAWVSETCGLSAPRQNGKNVALILRELYGMIGLGENVLHTAHVLTAAQHHLREMLKLFGTKRDDPNAPFPELNRLVKRTRSLAGQESIELTNGSVFQIAARSPHAGRSKSFDLLVCDEAQHMSDEENAALRPTISAAPKGSPQVILVGTPPGGQANGDVFARVRSNAMSGNTTRSSWMEWSADAKADLDSRDVWAGANPGLGRHVSLHTIESERAEFPDDIFARERLGVWAASASSHVISPDLWAIQADPESRAVDHLALAADVTPDRSGATIAVAGQRADGLWHIEIEDQRSGVGWVAPTLINLCRKNPIRAVVVDGGSQARAITEDLSAERIRATVTNSQQMAAACGQYYDGICEGWLHHLGQPHLNYALSAARKRSLLGGDAWGWNRKSADADITPVVATTLALWGAQAQSINRPTRRQHTGDRRAVLL